MPRVRELLDTYPTLIAELSYRGGITEGRGALAQEWRELFAKYADRFVIGSDTWIPEALDQLRPDHGDVSRLACTIAGRSGETDCTR